LGLTVRVTLRRGRGYNALPAEFRHELDPVDAIRSAEPFVTRPCSGWVSLESALRRRGACGDGLESELPARFAHHTCTQLLRRYQLYVINITI